MNALQHILELAKQMEDLTSAKTEILPKPAAESRSGMIRSLEHELYTYKKRYNLALEISLSIAAVGLLVALVLLLRSDIYLFYSVYLKPLLAFWPNVLGVIAILAVGFNLFNLKWFARRYFSIIEITVALGIGWYGVTRLLASSYMDAVALILAAVYLVERGTEDGLSDFYSTFRRRSGKAKTH